MGGVDRPVGKEMVEPRAQHAEVVGHRLQQAVAALLAGGAEVVALDEQHLHQRATLVVQLLGVAFDLGTGLRRHRATGRGLAVDAYGAHLAAAVRLEFRVIAQVRDVVPGGERGLDHALPGRERDFLAVEQKAVGHLELVVGIGHGVRSR